MAPGPDKPVPADAGVTIIRQLNDMIVCCKGRITSDTTQALKGTVKPLLSEGKRVVLDLNDVNHLDSSGLGTIIGLYVSAKVAKCQLKVIYSNERLKQLFRLTKLDRVLAQQA